ncbi:kinetochore protein Nuf2 isoform X2 [Narcine bancroftii]
MLPGAENLPYPQLFENCVLILNLYVCMQSLTSLCAIPNFVMIDLLSPKIKRTTMILSGIISFLQIRKSALETYLNQQQSFKLNLEMMQQMISSNEELKYRIQRLRTIPPDEQAKIDTLSAEVTELKQLINCKYQQKQSSVQIAAAQLKVEIAEQNKELSQMKVTLIVAKESQAQLKSMIVECPEQQKNEILAMTETVEKKKNSLQLKNERTLELQDKSANLINFQKKELETFCSFLKQSQTDYDQISSMNTECWNAENKLDRKKMELEKMQAEETRLKKVLSSKLGKQDKLQMQMRKKREARKHNLDSMAAEYDRIKLRNQEMTEQVAQISSERQHILAKIQLWQESSEKDAHECEDFLSKLYTHLEQYHERLATVTQKATHERCEQKAELERTMNERI